MDKEENLVPTEISIDNMEPFESYDIGQLKRCLLKVTIGLYQRR